MDDRSAKGYDDRKICKCVVCGVDVSVTKFASASKVKCNNCKGTNKQPDPIILGQASKDSTIQPGTNTKPSKCVQCGADTKIGKFASHKTTLCAACKGLGSIATNNHKDNSVPRIKLDLSRVDYSKLPQLDEYYVLPTIIKNPRLRQVKCPACGREFMKIIKIMDWSIYGAVITYQCVDCYTGITVSEQPQTLMMPSEFDDYDYTGEIMEANIPKLQHTRYMNNMRMVLGVLRDNNIGMDGLPQPRAMRNIDNTIPRGLSVAVNTDDITLAEIIDTLSVIMKVDRRMPNRIVIGPAMLNMLRQYDISIPQSKSVMGIPIELDESLGDKWRVEYAEICGSEEDNT